MMSWYLTFGSKQCGGLYRKPTVWLNLISSGIDEAVIKGNSVRLISVFGVRSLISFRLELINATVKERYRLFSLTMRLFILIKSEYQKTGHLRSY